MTKHKIPETVIKKALFKKGLKDKDVCKTLGINFDNFLNCMNGKQKFNAAEFLSLCLYLNLNLEDFKECNL